ncbi:polymer-forming cytoskeletal protein [Methyloligella sp. 2.7D]|uniref:bactofilin family protein n=1 Tax=unclassified Methyloligella TaxID=2625955 RepID=UPI00157CC876|nr:polymer-forming cytoskeletal protein [Methyloligella sp. GL2]QKP77807.1 polymer-forming cytoskeletal protein [Methyloligella sp. GL2]
MFTKKPERGTPGDKQPSFGSSAEKSRPFGERASQAAPKPAAPVATPSPSSASKSYSKAVPSIIGEDLTIIGNVISKGEIQVDGEIQGDVKCVSLLLGEKSRVSGGVIADDVVVRGNVSGSIRGLRVTLQAESHVEGDIYHQSLAIEQGAYFEGKSRRSEDPVNVSVGETPKPAASSPAPSSSPSGFSSAPVKAVSSELEAAKPDPAAPETKASAAE